MRCFAICLTVIAAASLTTPVAACDIDIPAELERMRPGTRGAVKGWQSFSFSIKSGVDGWLFYRHVRQEGLPSGAAEQRLLQDYVPQASNGVLGGRIATVKIQKSQTARLTYRTIVTPVRIYNVELTRKGSATPDYAAVIVRANPARKDIAIIVAPMDSNGPNPDPETAMPVARRLAAHPGFECTDGNSP